MQILFSILTAITAGIIAKQRHASFFAWGALAALTSLLIDSLLAVRLAGRFIDAFTSDEGAFLAVVLLKCAFLGIIVFDVTHALRYTESGKRATGWQIIGFPCAGLRVESALNNLITMRRRWRAPISLICSLLDSARLGMRRYVSCLVGQTDCMPAQVSSSSDNNQLRPCRGCGGRP